MCFGATLAGLRAGISADVFGLGWEVGNKKTEGVISPHLMYSRVRAHTLACARTHTRAHILQVFIIGILQGFRGGALQRAKGEFFSVLFSQKGELFSV